MIDFFKEEAEAVEGWFSAYDMENIYPALKDSKRDDIYLEIGVDRGRSLTFAKKYFNGDVFGIDIKTQKERGGLPVKGANFIHANSLDVSWNLPIKVLFVDGEHSYLQVKAEWEKYWPFVVKGGWVFWHDADETSPGVVEFLKELKGVKYSKNPRCSMAWKKK
jgi:hypothetical protein